MAFCWSSIALTILVLILSESHLSHSHTLSDDVVDLHDVLPEYGFPRGILPNNIKSYSLADDGSFEVKLTSDCQVQFKDQPVYYYSNIKGKLSFGEITDMVGISAKKYFGWFPVRGILVDHAEKRLVFDVGFVTDDELPISQFEDIPVCKAKLAYSL